MIPDGRSQTRLPDLMMNVFNSRRPVIVAAIILLAGGLAHEEWLRAGNMTAHYPPVPAVPADAGSEFVMTNSNFAATVDLWLNPGTPAYEAARTFDNFVIESELNQADFDRLVTRGNDGRSAASFLTFTDKNINYALFSIGNFKTTLNLTPVNPDPQAVLPDGVKPGLSGSFNF
jgi:hypothetical protein